MLRLNQYPLLRPLLAALVGATTTLAFAPYGYWPIAILSPALLLLLLQNTTGKRAALIGYCWGLGQFTTGINWVHVSIDTFGGMPKAASVTLMLLLICYLSLYSGLFAGLLNRLSPKASPFRLMLAAPALWLFADLARGWVMTGFPWLWLGYSQIDSPLASLAPIGGVQLITLAVVAIASSLSYCILNKQWRGLLLPIVIFCASLGLKGVSWVTPDLNQSTSFALIQGNIPQALKWLPTERWPTLMKYLDLSRANWDADIVIWPEAAIPAMEHELPNYLSNVDSAARQNQTALITGVLTKGEQGQFYNSVITLGDTPSGPYSYTTQPRYKKSHLLPFGEFVPFESLLRPIAPFFNLPMSSFSSGSPIQENIVAKERHLAVALCYEIIFADLVRDNITEQTDFILTLSNDAWFGDSIGPLQHMEIARMRALELGKPVIRATNNGVTAIADHLGQVIAKVPQFTTDVLRAEIVSTKGKTPYLILGNIPSLIFMFIAFLFCLRGYLFKGKIRQNLDI